MSKTDIKNDFDYLRYMKLMSQYYLDDCKCNERIKAGIQNLARKGYAKAIQAWYKIKDKEEVDEKIDKIVDCFDLVSPSLDESYAAFLRSAVRCDYVEQFLLKDYGDLFFKLAMKEIENNPESNILGYEKALEIAYDFKDYTKKDLSKLKPKKARKYILRDFSEMNKLADVKEIDAMTFKFAYAKNLYLFGDESDKTYAKGLFYDISRHDNLCKEKENTTKAVCFTLEFQ